MGLSFRGTILDNAPAYCFDLVKGLHVPAAVRGTDAEAAGQEGRYAGNRVIDIWTGTLEGYIRGQGATVAERRESFHDLTATVLALFQRDLDPGDLVADNGYLGIPAGEVWTLSARAANVVPGEIVSGQTFQLWSFGMEAVEPAEWVVESS